ncbi:hypothetical protein BJ508DRAFT_124442 [Ascobolus immersus RN42]|uniref:Cora-domain-containing protein n=1 Tax=Ascobolus immersus RN42 TaxID=1160509 RepID=A0A3N4I489_ASCIM|nr:hypothetical protein BJ508DRAFT_124442 [Ascobolus immersus RN42]
METSEAFSARHSGFEYNRKLSELTNHLPHLSVAQFHALSQFGTSRYLDGSKLQCPDHRIVVTTVDIAAGTDGSGFQTSSKTSYLEDSKFSKANSSISNGRLLRVVIAENLAPGLATERLGKKYNVDPQVFADYLVGADLGLGPGAYYRGSSSGMTSLRNRHITVQWSRLVALNKEAPPLSDIKEYQAMTSFAVPYVFRTRYRLMNIFRSWRNSMELVHIPDPSDVTGMHDVVALDEKATLSWVESNDDAVSTVLLLTDPIPHIQQSSDNKHSIMQAELEPHDYGAPIVKPLATRGNWDPVLQLDLSQEHESIQVLGQAFSRTYTQSTGQTIQQWVKEHYESVPDSLEPLSPSNAGNVPKVSSQSDIVAIMLFTIVLRDSWHILACISSQLQRLHQTSQEPEVIVKELTSIQTLLGTYRAELHKLHQAASTGLQAIHTIVSYPPSHRKRSFPRIALGSAYRPSIINGLPTSVSEEAKECFEDLLALQKEIEVQQAAVQEVSSHLMSTMSIIESQKAIGEAESVTKLTEMAFFFLPLGFSASIFGMQIKEFENNVSIYVWVVTAIAAVAGSYIVRLVVRSRFLTRQKRRLMRKLRRHGGGADSDAPIPSTAIFKLLWAFLEYEVWGGARRLFQWRPKKKQRVATMEVVE